MKRKGTFAFSITDWHWDNACRLNHYHLLKPRMPLPYRVNTMPAGDLVPKIALRRKLSKFQFFFCFCFFFFFWGGGGLYVSLYPLILVKSLHCIWRSCTRRFIWYGYPIFNELQWLHLRIGHRNISPSKPPYRPTWPIISTTYNSIVPGPSNQRSYRENHPEFHSTLDNCNSVRLKTPPSCGTVQPYGDVRTWQLRSAACQALFRQSIGVLWSLLMAFQHSAAIEGRCLHTTTGLYKYTGVLQGVCFLTAPGLLVMCNAQCTLDISRYLFLQWTHKLHPISPP